MKEKIKDIGSVIIVWFMMAWDDIKDLLVTMITTFVVTTLLVHFLFAPVRVSGSSMYPNVLDGEIGFTSVISKNVSGIDRFDIVVIDSDRVTVDLIKRVIGLPGEEISYCNEQLYINGEPLAEEFLDTPYYQQIKANGQMYTMDFSYQLGENEYFCLGDNRPVSSDSRVYGPFSSKEIKATGLFVIFPFSEFGSKGK